MLRKHNFSQTKRRKKVDFASFLLKKQKKENAIPTATKKPQTWDWYVWYVSLKFPLQI